jgi:serine/threonine protein kinase
LIKCSTTLVVKHLGLNSSKIAVPLILTNGHLFLFATASLQDSLPVLHMVTDVLDANNPLGLDLIARMLAMAKDFVKSKAREIEQCSQQSSAVGISATTFVFDTDKFFVKEKDKVYNRFKPLDLEDGALPLLWDVFEALAPVEGAEKALGYCDLQLVGSREVRCLVFHNLLQQGYRMGVPEDAGDYREFLIALEVLVRQVHARGVIHVDLYPSNIMWAKVNGVVRIRIVDWDSATFAGQPLSEGMLLRLDARSPYVYRVTSGKASSKSDAWNVFLLSKVSAAADRAAMASRNAGTVNAAYHSFIDEQIMKYGSVNALHDAFLEWFKGFQGNGTHLPPPS